MNRDYDEHFECFNDTVCWQCGVDLPHEIEEGTPEFDGFCSEQCRSNNSEGKKNAPSGLVSAFLTETLGTENWSKAVFKGTECGAWIEVHGDTVRLGSIVEGSDAVAGPVVLVWPFTADEFFTALDGINTEACEIWEETAS